MPVSKPPIDLGSIRAQTRACGHFIHFNNAGASLPPAPVADSLHAYLRDEEMLGGYETQAAHRDELEHFYVAAAHLLNCSPGEIAFVENATRAWDMGFYSFDFQPGDRILCSYAEYGSSVIACLQQSRRTGVNIEFVPNDRNGQLDTVALERMLDDRVRLISVCHVPTGGGLVNPAAAVGRIARAHGIPYLLDACQSIGQMPLDVEELGCDLLSGTGRKYLRGPRGTGLLYVRRSLLGRLEPPLLDQHAAELIEPNRYRLRDDARRFENWEQNFAGKRALAVAIDYALAIGLDRIRDRIFKLASQLRKALAAIPGVTVTDQGVERCGIVTFHVDGLRAEQVKSGLAKRGIHVSAPAGSGSLVDYRTRGISDTVRASLHYYNSEQEIATFIEVLEQLVDPPARS